KFKCNLDRASKDTSVCVFAFITGVQLLDISAGMMENKTMNSSRPTATRKKKESNGPINDRLNCLSPAASIELIGMHNKKYFILFIWIYIYIRYNQDNA